MTGGNTILDRARASQGALRAEAVRSEAERQLTKEGVQLLRDAGVFGMTMSRRLDGPELDPLAQLDVIEAISVADGSAGWCAMIGSDGGYATSHLELDVVRTMYPSCDMATALVAAPSGRAVEAGDGYTVNGRWAFASGCTHADWVFVNCLVVRDGETPVGSDGVPLMRVVGVPATEIDVVDTWRTTGLAGSGSHDVAVEDVFIPAERTYSLFDSPPVDDAPLYRHRWGFFVNIGTVPLGIARAAIDDSIQVAQTKVSMPSFQPLRVEPTVQEHVARAEMLVASARAYLYDVVGTYWDALQEDASLEAPWLGVRLATTNAFRASKEAVNLLYEALGTSGVYATSPLDRQLRDITTMSQHIIVQPKTVAAVGRGLLGLPPDAIGF